jgi:AraC-like DNA-binding protein
MLGVRRFARNQPVTLVDFAELEIADVHAAIAAWPLAGFISFGAMPAVSIPGVCLLPEPQSQQAVTFDVDSSAVAKAAFGYLRSLNPASINLLRDPDCSPTLESGWNAATATYSNKSGDFALKCDSPSLFGSSPGEKSRFEQWLFNLPRPAAICCTTDLLAMAVMTTCRGLGLSAPEDIAVLTCENSRLAEQFQHGITGVSGAFENAGYEAAKLLLEVITGGEPAESNHNIVPGTGLTKRGSTDRLASLPEDVRLAQDYIQREACNGINVKDVMGTQNVSRVTFERRFKEYTGQTPGAEIRRIRIEKAESLLKSTDMPVSEVASQCGFDGSSRFSLFFRKRAGLSPSEFRARHRS